MPSLFLSNIKPQTDLGNGLNRRDAPKQLNETNILITLDDIVKLFNKFGIDGKPQNLALYQQAFVHSSYCLEEGDETEPNPNVSATCVPFQPKTYERLEYIGDAVINHVAAYYVFARFPDQEEGFLTTLRTKLVRSQTLARLTNRLRLNKYILVSKYVEDKCNGRNNPKILEDIFEALVGAIYLDFGPEAQGYSNSLKFIINVFERYLDITNMIRCEDNYKRVLLEYYQKTFKTEPKYQTISVTGPKNNRLYTMGALSPTGDIVGIGSSKKKREAENIASKNAAAKFGIVTDVDQIDEDQIDEDSTDGELSSE